MKHFNLTNQMVNIFNNMNLKEHIRKVLKEETDFKISDNKYSKLIKNIILDYVNFNICKLVVTQIESIKNQYLVILITDEQLKSSYREELQKHLNDYLPLTIYVSISDGQDCQNYKKRFLDQGAYIVRIEFGIKDVKEITGSIFPNVHIDKIRHQIENKITNFLPINNLYVGTSLTPECGEKRWWDTDND